MRVSVNSRRLIARARRGYYARDDKEAPQGAGEKTTVDGVHHAFPTLPSQAISGPEMTGPPRKFGAKAADGNQQNDIDLE